MNQAKMTLPSLENASFSGKRVVVRLDTDLPLSKNGQVTDTYRLEKALPTLKKCLNLASSVTIIGHLGRPEERDPKLSLRPIAELLGHLLKHPITFVDKIVKNRTVKSEKSGEKVLNLVMLENLRFWPGEADDEPEFAEILSEYGDLYVNESFASAHRRSASVTTLPRLLPTYFGDQFLAEVAAVERVLESPARPVVIALGGAKPDKLEFVPGLLKIADSLLLGGALPKFNKVTDSRLISAELTPDGLDISPASAQTFAKAIAEAATVVWNGPMGKFEDDDHMAGTKAVAEALASFRGFSLVGGGDTEAALEALELKNAPSHISTGGGAMMDFLVKGTLPAIEAVLASK